MYIYLIASFIFFVNKTNRNCPKTGLCLFYLLHLLGHQRPAVPLLCQNSTSANYASTRWVASKKRLSTLHHILNFTTVTQPFQYCPT